MPDIEAILQSPSGQRQLQLIDLLSGLDPVDDDHQVEIGALEEDPAQYGFTRSSLEGDLEVLQGWGWAEFWPSFGGIGSVMIKQSGLDAAREYRAFMKNRVQRRKACRDAVLEWLYEEDEETQRPFRQEKTFYGHPYTEQEEIDAKSWLKEEGFIQGPAKADGGIYYPQISSKGSRVVEAGRSVNESYSGGITVADHSINIHGSQNINLAQNSSNVTQSNTLTQEQLGKITGVLESYRTMSDYLGLPEDQLLEAETIVGELEEEAGDANAEPGKIRKGLERLGGIVTEHGAKGFATALFSLIEQALQNLG